MVGRAVSGATKCASALNANFRRGLRCPPWFIIYSMYVCVDELDSTRSPVLSCGSILTKDRTVDHMSQCLRCL